MDVLRFPKQVGDVQSGRQLCEVPICMGTDPPCNLLVGANSTGFNGDDGIDGTEIPLRNQRELDLSLERIGREKVDHWLAPTLFPEKVDLLPVLNSHFLDCMK